MTRLRSISAIARAALGLLLVPAGMLAAQSPSAPPVRGPDLAGMDRSVRPGDDFFRYTNGTWLDRTEIPADRSTYSVFGTMADTTDRRVLQLIQALGPGVPVGSERQKVRDYYASFMDATAIESKGLTPLQPTLDSIAAISDRTELARFLGSTLRADVDIFNNTTTYTENLLGLWVAQDLDEPTHYSPFLVQGGLGMPDRSYYLDSSATMAALREQYQPYVARLLADAGIADADAKAAALVGLETRIAQVHVPRQETSDVKAGNNHWSRAEFDRNAPGLDWGAYFGAGGLGKQERFVVWQPSAVTGISALTASEPLESWKAWLAFHAIQSRAEVLPGRLQNEWFAFKGTALTGAKQQRDRWQRAVAATNEAVGFAVGRIYVESYFPAADKARAQTMVAGIIDAFRTRIDKLDWMAPATKKEAKAKLAVMKVGIGYPDRWPDYAALVVRPGDAFGNLERARLYRLHRALARLDKPVDRSEWVMTPQTVNAVNLPAMNAMNFPAAILQPPYFDAKRPGSLNYGAIGAIIGHEISHSFDNSGALFDSHGRLHNWWTPADFEHFRASASQLAAQYDAYKPFPDLAVNGRLTLGENIADLAGLTASLDAYHRSLGGKPANDQQFFIAFGQAWRGKYREPALRNRLLTDGHSPNQYRSYTVRNIDAWYRAFGVTPGERLYLPPAERVRVW